MEKELMKGNDAIAEAAIKAGCDLFFGYPITPSTEIIEYMAKHLPLKGGEMVQAESEVSAINMVYGASGTGKRVMTASSSPGVSLKQEGISYLAANELPCVVVNIMRTGPGLGGLGPSQSDYFQATKGGGHGDYKVIVLGPSSVQEAAEHTQMAFDLADYYRNPVIVLGDGIIGQMMEPVVFSYESRKDLPPKDWATTGAKGRKPNIITHYNLTNEVGEEYLTRLEKKYQNIQSELQMYEDYMMEDAEYALVAFGTSARVCKSAVRMARKQGLKLGLIRPITLWPFPVKAFETYADQVKGFLTVELSLGQMIEDVRLAVNGKVPCYFHRRLGGMVPSPGEVYDRALEVFAVNRKEVSSSESGVY